MHKVCELNAYPHVFMLYLLHCWQDFGKNISHAFTEESLWGNDPFTRIDTAQL